MIFLALLFYGSCALAVEVAVEAGWAGRVVVSAVNPVWLTVWNPHPSPFSGEIQVVGKIGSPWRGEALYTAQIPLFLAPASRTKFLIPWLVELGCTSLKVSVLTETKELFSQEVPLNLAVIRFHGAIGPPGGGAEILLSSFDLPENPLFLWPFSRIDLFFGLSERGQAVIQAWVSFLGGESPLGAPCRVRFNGEVLRQKLRKVRPSPPLWLALIPGFIVYFFALGPVLSAFSRGRSAPLALLAVIFLGFSLFYGVFRETAASLSAYKIEVHCHGLPQFYLDLWGGVSWREEKLELPGFWVEVLPERGWQGLDLWWVYGKEGWKTRASFAPGQPRLFFRVAENQVPLAPAETISPPAWLVSALHLPWEKARLERTFLQKEAYQLENFRIFLP